MLDSTFLIYCLLLGAVGVSIFRAPAVAFGAFLCTYGLEQWAQSRSDYFYIHSSLTNILTTGVLLWALAMRQVKGMGIRVGGGGLPGVFWVTVALFAWAGFSLFWTPAYDDAVANWRKQAPYLLTTILLMPLVVGSLRDLRAAFMATLAMGSILLLLLMFDSGWQGRMIVLRQGAAIGSIMGERGNPLALASLAGWVTLIALLINPRGVHRYFQLARWPIVLLGLIIAFKSGSRGQLFAMVAAGLIFLPFSRRIRNMGGFLGAAAGVVLVLVLATWAFDQFTRDAGTRWNADEMISTWRGARLDTTMSLLNSWFEAGPIYWLIGLGTSAAYDPDIVGFYPHLVMGEVLGELGLIGFVLLWVLTIMAFRAYGGLHRLVSEDAESRGLAATLAALFLFEVILSFKQGSLLGSWFAFGFAVLLGRIWALERQSAQPSPSAFAPPEQQGYVTAPSESGW